MLDAGLSRRFYGTARRGQIDSAKLNCFRRAGMRDSHQLHECVGGANVLAVGVGIESVSKNRLTT